MDDMLMHYGIKGMRWGVRRSEKQLEKVRGKKNGEDDAKKQDMKTASKNRRLLTESDLKKRIERIKLEKQLKDLTDEELSPGRKAVNDILVSSGKSVATKVVAGAALYGIKVAMTKKFNWQEAASYVAPKPKNK